MILSVGHSGSTLLDKAIGSNSKAFSLGEIINFHRIIENRKSLCGCQSTYAFCPFWTDFIRKIEKRDEFLDGNFELNYKVKSLKDLLCFINCLLFSKKSNYTNKIIRKNEVVYDELFKKTGSSLLIDSSKSLFRSLLIYKFIKKYDYRFIHLVRDGRTVLNSYQKKTYNVFKDGRVYTYNRKVQNPKLNVAYWFRYNVKSLVLLNLLRIPKKIIRYEDFVNNPVRSLNSISEFIGVNYEVNMVDLGNKTNHMCWGNASRINALKIKPQTKRIMDFDLLKYFTSMPRLLNRMYGYKK